MNTDFWSAEVTLGSVLLVASSIYTSYVEAGQGSRRVILMAMLGVIVDVLLVFFGIISLAGRENVVPVGVALSASAATLGLVLVALLLPLAELWPRAQRSEPPAGRPPEDPPIVPVEVPPENDQDPPVTT